MLQTEFLDSAYVRQVSRHTFEDDGYFFAFPDNLWDIVVMRRGRNVRVLRTGLTSRPDKVSYQADDEFLVVSFQPYCFMPSMPGQTMLNAGVSLELFGGNTVEIDSSYREIPTWDNVESFVGRLAATGAIGVDPIVRDALRNCAAVAAERTLQRHFRSTTGLSYKHFGMVERAQRAASMLRLGQPAVEVALSSGYFDQAHMTNDLNRIMGHTPRDLARLDSPFPGGFFQSSYALPA